MLTDLEPMVGLWQGKGDQNPAGSLHRICWEDDGLLWSRLKTGMTLDIHWEPLLKFSHGTLATGNATLIKHDLGHKTWVDLISFVSGYRNRCCFLKN